LHNTNNKSDLFFSKKLLAWYQVNKRTLPWRGEKDPYRIWLSEVMLQQTQVETVKPYYEKWLKKYPDIKSVAEAGEEALLKTWEGLGYYSRCRNFHKACKIVMDQFGGKVPNDWDQFISFPGVGDYTAAAVLSMAFGKSYPLLDGNVYRVMSRLLVYDKSIEKGGSKFIGKLEKWIDEKFPGEFNQAMMELGSLVCRKKQPRCFECPLTDYCKAYKKGVTDKFPVKQKLKLRPHYTVVVGVILKERKFLIQKRPSRGHLGGLWELPGGKVYNGELLSHALKREIREETGLELTKIDEIGKVDHAYSHFSITLHGYLCRLEIGKSSLPKNIPRKWIYFSEIEKYPFPKASHKLFKLMKPESFTKSH